MKSSLGKHGFTLVEVLVAMMILASISILTASSISRSSEIKRKTQASLDRFAKFRSALKLMESDIQSAFHHQDLRYEILKNIEAEEKKTAEEKSSGGSQEVDSDSESNEAKDDNDESQTENNESNSEDEGEAKPLVDLENYPETLDKTAFIGFKDEIHLTNLNHVRTRANERAGNQQEVGYFVKPCRNRLDPEKNYNCLWRRTTPFIDDNIDEGGNEFVLLENIKVFKLEYFGRGKEEWVNTWLSDDRGDSVTKGVFPYAVRLSISFEEDGKIEEALVTIPIRHPNNPIIEENQEEGGLEGEEIQE
ncbi:MAG: type II secretion system protein J [Bdellovibrionales bacterium]